MSGSVLNTVCYMVFKVQYDVDIHTARLVNVEVDPGCHLPAPSGESRGLINMHSFL